jgi:hypothetical protein
MNELHQLENSLRQVRQTFNSMVNQLNRDLVTSENIIEDVKNKLIQQTGQCMANPALPCYRFYRQKTRLACPEERQILSFL